MVNGTSTHQDILHTGPSHLSVLALYILKPNYSWHLHKTGTYKCNTYTQPDFSAEETFKTPLTPTLNQDQHLNTSLGTKTQQYSRRPRNVRKMFSAMYNHSQMSFMFMSTTFPML